MLTFERLCMSEKPKKWYDFRRPCKCKISLGGSSFNWKWKPSREVFTTLPILHKTQASSDSTLLWPQFDNSAIIVYQCQWRTRLSSAFCVASSHGFREASHRPRSAPSSANSSIPFAQTRIISAPFGWFFPVSIGNEAPMVSRSPFLPPPSLTLLEFPGSPRTLFASSIGAKAAQRLARMLEISLLSLPRFCFSFSICFCLWH